MSSSPPQSSSSASPGDLPQRIFDVDCYPGHVVRINSYSRPRYLVDILDILAGLPELQTLLASPLDILAAFVVFTVVSVALATAPQPPIPAPNRPLLDNPTSLLAGNSVRLRPSRVVLSVFLSVFLSGLCEGTNSML
ncbi:uncharacterized protein LOC111829561 isoform X2 [Capsella rubella]|uniref:uncharacterized protein LOC111829561 isoform X2 n=1 Tax=Capsella rubella TaxID=81985 RepID=UPI000CD4CC5D|nr:uncharacterized protein LOC111829561 isoform X2 [Capsella rubella]